MSAGDTSAPEYAERLEHAQRVWWKRIIPVQLPYQLNLRRRRLGRTLDVGCGIGRNLGTLQPGSVGVDHNAAAVAYAKQLGHHVMTVDDFFASDLAVRDSFDAILLAHVIEHLDPAAAKALLLSYLPFLRPGGRVFFICPQERGYASDATHVWFATDEELARLARSVGLDVTTSYSFPFPRRAGRLFIYNEFCVEAAKPGTAHG